MQLIYIPQSIWMQTFAIQRILSIFEEFTLNRFKNKKLSIRNAFVFHIPTFHPRRD